MSKKDAKARRAGRRDAPPDEDAIYERVLAAILEHRLAPGIKLGEDRLARIFGVTRARVRNVLPRLAHEGVVRLEPNRGAFVSQPTVSEARDVFEARRVIEPGILERLVQRGDLRPILVRLRQHVAAERRARAANDKRSIVRLSGEFHILLAEMAGNELLAKVMRELASITCLIIALYDKPTVPSCLGEEHAELLEALSEGDAARAMKLMVQHLNHVEENLDFTATEHGAPDLESALG